MFPMTLSQRNCIIIASTSDPLKPTKKTTYVVGNTLEAVLLLLKRDPAFFVERQYYTLVVSEKTYAGIPNSFKGKRIVVSKNPEKYDKGDFVIGARNIFQAMKYIGINENVFIFVDTARLLQSACSIPETTNLLLIHRSHLDNERENEIEHIQTRLLAGHLFMTTKGISGKGIRYFKKKHQIAVKK
jgi:hypothetical protein